MAFDLNLPRTVRLGGRDREGVLKAERCRVGQELVCLATGIRCNGRNTERVGRELGWFVRLGQAAKSLQGQSKTFRSLSYRQREETEF